jgi:hypothetical protein
MIKTKSRKVAIDRGDLLAVWAVLENLTVSLDQIGGAYGATGAKRNGPNHARRNGDSSNRTFLEALGSYFTPALVRAIRDARTRVGHYVSDGEAERIVDTIPYWDYRSDRSSTRRKT